MNTITRAFLQRRGRTLKANHTDRSFDLPKRGRIGAAVKDLRFLTPYAATSAGATGDFYRLTAGIVQDRFFPDDTFRSLQQGYIVLQCTDNVVISQDPLKKPYVSDGTLTIDILGGLSDIPPDNNTTACVVLGFYDSTTKKLYPLNVHNWQVEVEVDAALLEGSVEVTGELPPVDGSAIGTITAQVSGTTSAQVTGSMSLSGTLSFSSVTGNLTGAFVTSPVTMTGELNATSEQRVAVTMSGASISATLNLATAATVGQLTVALSSMSDAITCDLTGVLQAPALSGLLTATGETSAATLGGLATLNFSEGILVASSLTGNQTGSGSGQFTGSASAGMEVTGSNPEWVAVINDFNGGGNYDFSGTLAGNLSGELTTAPLQGDATVALSPAPFNVDGTAVATFSNANVALNLTGSIAISGGNTTGNVTLSLPSTTTAGELTLASTPVTLTMSNTASNTITATLNGGSGSLNGSYTMAATLAALTGSITPTGELNLAHSGSLLLSFSGGSSSSVPLTLSGTLSGTASFLRRIVLLCR